MFFVSGDVKRTLEKVSLQQRDLPLRRALLWAASLDVNPLKDIKTAQQRIGD